MAQHSPRILLDAASGPLHPRARETLSAALDAGWADPRRLYAEGRLARRLLDQAREVISAGLRVRPEELSFLPSGTAALREGLLGMTHAARRRGATVVRSAVEHSAVLQTAAALEPGGPALVPVDSVGRIDLAAWRSAVLGEGVVAAALQHANAEIGTTQPLALAHAESRAGAIPLLVDATASLGRTAPPADWDVLAGDARSFAGPAGVGLLAVRTATRWSRPGLLPEDEYARSAVEPVIPLVLAAAEAWQQVAADRDRDEARARALVDRLRQVLAAIPDVEVVGDPVDRLPHVLTCSVLYLDGESLVGELDRRGFAVASGSMCTASSLEPSHVLAAIGALTHGNIRITLPLSGVAPHREQDVEAFTTAFPSVVRELRSRYGVEGL